MMVVEKVVMGFASVHINGLSGRLRKVRRDQRQNAGTERFGKGRKFLKNRKEQPVQ